MRRVAAGGVLLALLAGGCGGDDAGPQTRDTFIAEADLACATVRQELAARGADNPRTVEQIAQANNVLADAYGELARKLRRLRLPDKAGRAGAQAFVASVGRTEPSLARLRSTARALVAAGAGNDARALTAAANDVRAALDGFRRARAASDRLAIDYGFVVCGNLG